MNIKELIQKSFPSKDLVVKNIIIQEKESDGTPMKVVILGKRNDGRYLIAEVEIKNGNCDINKSEYFKDFVPAMSEYAKYKRKVA